MRQLCHVILFSILAAALAPSARAGMVFVPGASGGLLPVKVTSIKEARFRTTVRQKYDFSCGSAAIATLLTFHYESPIDEEEVFRAMYDAGDREKIRKEGFSLLDMKKYLDARGYRSDGYRATLDKLAAVRLPAIVLVNHNGYRHFVVVKGVTARDVLIGDPAAGTKVIARADFEEMWNGLLFLVRSNMTVAQNHFNNAQEWGGRLKAPLGTALNSTELANITWLLPGRNDF